MEIGEHSLSRLKSIIEAADLQMHTKGGFIINARLGTLVALRNSLKSQGMNVVYCTISEQQLYLVHWNDLSPAKQEELETKRKNGVTQL